MMKLYATSPYVSGYVPVIGDKIRSDENWPAFELALQQGFLVSFYGRSYSAYPSAQEKKKPRRNYYSKKDWRDEMIQDQGLPAQTTARSP